MALPLILLVGTGVPLQFTDQLGLGRKYIDWSWVIDAYGITAPAQSIRSDNAIQTGERLFVGDRTVETPTPMVGAAQLDFATVIGTRSHTYLIPDDAATPLETIAMPQPAGRFGHRDNTLYIRLHDAPMSVLASDDFGLTWHSSDGKQAQWARLATIATDEDVRVRYLSGQITWERWLQDLHGGRFFGPIGEWIMTFASLALFFLALSGIWVWWRLRR